MKTTIPIELLPFVVPDDVLIISSVGQGPDGVRIMSGYPLSGLDSETLDKLCREFSRDVFRKAGKAPPPTAG